jgi:hypothetical protein
VGRNADRAGRRFVCALKTGSNAREAVDSVELLCAAGDGRSLTYYLLPEPGPRLCEGNQDHCLASAGNANSKMTHAEGWCWRPGCVQPAEKEHSDCPRAENRPGRTRDFIRAAKKSHFTPRVVERVDANACSHGRAWPRATMQPGIWPGE